MSFQPSTIPLPHIEIPEFLTPQPETIISIRESARRFAEVSLPYWQLVEGRRLKHPQGTVLVDMIHEVPEYLHHSIVIGKYLQLLLQRNVVGVTVSGTAYHRLYPLQNQEHLDILAKGFNLQKLIVMDMAHHTEQLLPVALSEQLDRFLLSFIPAEPEQYADIFRNFKADDGIELGKYVYETVLRANLLPTLEAQEKPVLLSWVKQVALEALLLHDFYRNTIRENNVTEVVTGHFSYHLYGLLTEVAIRYGAEVYNFHCGNRNLFKINASTMLHNLPGSAHRTANAYFFRLLKKNRSRQLDKTVDECVTLMNDGRFLHPAWWIPQTLRLDQDKAQIRGEALAKLNWSGDRKTISVFAHCFSDAIFNDDQLYDNYFSWVENTLQLAQSQPDRNWLIKIHPMDAVYDETGTGITRLLRQYANLDHIRFICDDELNKTELYAITDLGVTLRGSLGYDFAAAGIPFLLAGKAHYSEWEFVREAHSIEEYVALLKGDLDQLAPSAKQTRNARQFLFMHHVLGTYQSRMFPAYGSVRKEDYWQQCIYLLQGAYYQKDPLFQSLKLMLKQRYPRLINQTLAEQLFPLPESFLTRLQKLFGLPAIPAFAVRRSKRP